MSVLRGTARATTLWPVVFLLLGLACASSAAQPVSPPEPSGAAPSLCSEEQGDLVEYIVGVERELPKAGSTAYADPDIQQAGRLVDALLRLAQGDCEGAVSLAAPHDLEAVRFVDTRDGGEAHLLLRQRQPCTSACWGLVVLNPKARRAWLVVEVPHPLFDQETPRFAAEAYLSAGARSLLMASTHRRASCVGEACASDVAHNPTSLFQRFHEALVDACSTVVQYHGFARTADRQDYPEVVLSSGSPVVPGGLLALRDALVQRGISADTFDGERYRDLGATTNVQGQQTRNKGATFYHMEHTIAVRRDAGLRAAAVEALLVAEGTPETREPGGCRGP